MVIEDECVLSEGADAAKMNAVRERTQQRALGFGRKLSCP